MGRRKYSPTFMNDAVQMVRDGHTVEQVASELGIPNGTLWNWVQAGNPTDSTSFHTDNLEISPEQRELKALRKRIADLEQENAFLGKVSAYFASKRRQ